MTCRILIFGLPGSGKSTFSSKLGEALKIPTHHLDRHFFLSTWQERDYEEFLNIQSQLVYSDKWIIDGNATSSLEVRYQKATLAIYFHYPRLHCLWRMIKRVVLRENLQDIPEGCSKYIRWRLIRYMWSFHQKRGKESIQELQRKYPHVQFYSVRSDQETSSLFQKILKDFQS